MNNQQPDQPSRPKPFVLALGVALLIGGFFLNEFTSDSWSILGLILMLLGALLAAPLAEPLRDKLDKRTAFFAGAALVIGGLVLYMTVLISIVRLLAVVMGVTGAVLMPRVTAADLKRSAPPPENENDERSEEVH